MMMKRKLRKMAERHENFLLRKMVDGHSGEGDETEAAKNSGRTRKRTNVDLEGEDTKDGSTSDYLVSSIAEKKNPKK